MDMNMLPQSSGRKLEPENQGIAHAMLHGHA